MKENTFDIQELTNNIVNIILQDEVINKETIRQKITSCLQRNIDCRLVPKNYNRYGSKKNREKWIKELQKKEYETRFWKEIVKRIDHDNIQGYYDELNRMLDEQQLRFPFGTTSQIVCFYCERKVDAGKFGGDMGVYITKDHVIPKSKFGKTHNGNLVNACNECNLFKSDFTIKQFVEMIDKNISLGISFQSITVDLYPVIKRNALTLLKPPKSW